MRNIAPTLLALAVLFLLLSCSSEEIKSSQNYIIEFKINGIKGEIKNDQAQINIYALEEDYDNLLNTNEKPEIAVSEKATPSPDCEVWKGVNYSCTVTAENGDKKSYSVKIDKIRKKYSFESWATSEGTHTYYIPSDENSSWSSGNAGIAMALALLGKDSKDPEIYPARKTDEGKIGKAVLMETIEGGIVFGRDVSLISGNFFLGNFDATKAIIDELAATEVGRIYPAKPKTIKGYYKYTEGPGDFKNKGASEPGRPDSCNMSIRFYQSDNDTTLTIKDIDTSDLIIGRITKADCSDTGGEFQEFALELVYAKEPDFANHSYKLAITFAASRNGDKYAGKIGSQFIVDEIEIEDY